MKYSYQRRVTFSLVRRWSQDPVYAMAQLSNSMYSALLLVMRLHVVGSVRALDIYQDA